MKKSFYTFIRQVNDDPELYNFCGSIKYLRALVYDIKHFDKRFPKRTCSLQKVYDHALYMTMQDEFKEVLDELAIIYLHSCVVWDEAKHSDYMQYKIENAVVYRPGDKMPKAVSDTLL